MKRLLVIVLVSMSMGLFACSSDSSVTSPPTSAYDTKAVAHILAAMVESGEFKAPNGGPVSKTDQDELLKLVAEACKGPGKIQTMIQTLEANPYLLAQALKLANAGCPKLIADMGIKVNE